MSEDKKFSVAEEIESRKAAEAKMLEFVVGKLHHVEDYPKKGVDFIDILPVLADPTALNVIAAKLLLHTRSCTCVVSPEARGFVPGSIVAAGNSVGLVLLRKEGKSPQSVQRIIAPSEYGISILEIEDEVLNNLKKQVSTFDGRSIEQKIVICDDVLATGTTAVSILEFLHYHGIKCVQFISIVEIESLKGAKLLSEKARELGISDFNIYSVVKI